MTLRAGRTALADVPLPPATIPPTAPPGGEYAAKTARERQERRDQSREIGDYQAVRKKSRRWRQEMARRKGLRER